MLFTLFCLFFIQNLPLTPVIIKDGENWSIAIDRIVIFSEPLRSFALAVQTWFASFWVLSIQYPKCVNNTCLFYEKVFLNGKGKVPASISKWANRLLL